MAGEERFSVSIASRANYVILAVAVVVLIMLAVFPLFGGMPWTRRMVDFFILLALAQLWNMMLGYGGIISVGQQGFIGIGAYVLWLFADILHVNPFLSVIFAAIGGVIIALPTAALVFKLKGGYLAIGTWVIAETLRLIVSNIKSAGAGSGTSVQAAADMSTNVRVYGTYWWALGLAVIATAGPYLILRSRTGLALKSMRDNDQAAKSCGINIWRIKLYTFLIAGAGSAAAGAITAIHVLRVQPGAMFSIQWMAYIIFIGVIGGVGVIEGPIIGTVIYFVLRETTSKYGEWYFIILGIVAIVVVIWSPNGIYGYIYKKTRFLIFPLQRKLSPRDDALGAVKIATEGGDGPG
jgi:branched-chain amino acid transport system permease protein